MKIDTEKYKVWTWKHPLMLHWMINPGLAINELILGQTIPKLSLIEKNSRKPVPEKTFIPCPHCSTIHSGLKWTPQNKTAFGNWFGLYCDNCGGIMPCLRNITSLLILALTSPVWIWFVKPLKRKWLEIQKRKFSKPLALTPPEVNWVAQGLGWGFFMFVFMELIFPVFEDDGYKLSKLLLGGVIWTLAGLSFGYSMKKFMKSQAAKESKGKSQQATLE